METAAHCHIKTDRQQDRRMPAECQSLQSPQSAQMHKYSVAAIAATHPQLLPDTAKTVSKIKGWLCALQFDPFRIPIWPISHAKMTLFREQNDPFCNSLAISTLSKHIRFAKKHSFRSLPNDAPDGKIVYSFTFLQYLFIRLIRHAKFCRQPHSRRNKTPAATAAPPPQPCRAASRQTNQETKIIGKNLYKQNKVFTFASEKNNTVKRE